MHSNGFDLLLIPILGLFAICRGGTWHWRVASDALLNGLFWFGWFTTLLAGAAMITGVG